MTHLKQVFFGSLISLQCFSGIFASDEPIESPKQSNKDFVESYLNKPLKIEEDLKVVLDGSPAASDLERKSLTQSRLVYIDSENWRALRTRPLQRDAKEYFKSQGQLFEMTSGNQRNRIATPVSDNFWVEIIAAPLQYAREWNLCEMSASLKDLLEKLKDAEGHILKNAEGDQVLAEFKDDQNIILTAKGKFLQDGKTQVQVESVWRLSMVGNAGTADLESSLLRSHDQK